jgi:hypothetical protein
MPRQTVSCGGRSLASYEYLGYQYQQRKANAPPELSINSQIVDTAVVQVGMSPLKERSDGTIFALLFLPPSVHFR